MAVLVLCTMLPPVFAAGYPEKPIRWVVPSTPGGGTDTTTRIVAPKLSEILGQPVVIENRPGASGNVGAASVAKTPPDGCTLVTCIASHASNAALMTNIPFDLARDFSPISLLVTLPNVLVGNPSLQPKTVKELIAYAKADPGKMQYSSGGLGSIQHMTMELFQNMTGTKMLHVPYKATHPALMDAVSGYVPLTVASSLTTLPLVLKGVMQAPVTPLREDFSLDLPTLERAADFHVRTGATGITWPYHKSEPLNLTIAERKAGAEAVVKATAGRVPVAIHVSALALEDSLDLARHAQKAGADCGQPRPPLLRTADAGCRDPGHCRSGAVAQRKVRGICADTYFRSSSR